MTEAAASQMLFELEAIKQLKARYFRFMDTKQWDRLAELFVENVTIEGDHSSVKAGHVAMEIDNPVPRYGSVKEFIDGLIEEGPELQTIHGHMPEIELTGPNTARGVWAMFDYLTWDEGWARARDLPEAQYGFVGYGDYEEEYVKQDGTWKIARMRLRGSELTGWE